MPTKDEVHNSNEVQAPADKHDTKYDNDTSEKWLNGPDATQKPGFDKGNAWRKGKGL